MCGKSVCFVKNGLHLEIELYENIFYQNWIDPFHQYVEMD